jgi:hypothetical protein
MQGNLHVRFLGEGVAARRPPYPTYDEGSIPFTRSNRSRRSPSFREDADELVGLAQFLRQVPG